MIQLHRKYLFNKTNIIIIVAIILLTILLNIIIVNPFIKSIDVWMIREEKMLEFINSNILFTKMITILLSIYLYGITFTKNYDNYHILLITRITIKKYFLSKVFMLTLEILKLIILFFLINLWIGIYFTKWYYIKIDFIIEYIKIFLLSITYGLLSLIFTRVIKNIYSVLLITANYVFSEIVISETNNSFFINYIQLFLPTTILNANDYKLHFGIYHLLLLIHLYLSISYSIYCYKRD